MGAGACSISIHRHALSRTGGVGERVLIVMAQTRTTKDPARRTRWTGLRNTAPDEVISMCRIRSVDASSNHTAARCPGWRSRGCRSWGAAPSSIGTDQPVTRNSEVIDEADGIVVADIVDIHWTPAAHRRQPALPMEGAILVDALEEVLRSIIHRSHIADEEASERTDVNRRTEGVVDKCVCARILNRAGDRSQQDPVARIPIAIWIAPNGDRYRRPIHRRVRENRRAPGDAYCANHRLTSNDVELVKPKRLEVLRSVTKPDSIF